MMKALDAWKGTALDTHILSVFSMFNRIVFFYG